MMRTATTCFRFFGAALLAVLFTGSAFAQRTVTLKLNTATAPDTLDAMDVIQIRGAVDDAAPFTLPDANVIDWGDATTIRPMNVGGDNWELTFQIPENAKLNFKAYSPLLHADGNGNPDGWESGDNHQVDAGVGDVELPLHFFNKTDGNQAYDWQPYEDKPDSFAVWFRAFMNTEDAVTKGYDPSDPTQVIGLRGDPMNGMSPLSWDLTLVEVTSESADLAHPGYHLFSGVAYYPDAAAGMTQAYKFFREPDGWEADIAGTGNRMLTLPATAADTTVHWVYFSNSPPVTSQSVTSDVIFAVDLSPFDDIGIFKISRDDSLLALGDFNNWPVDCPNPDVCLMVRELGTEIFSTAIPITTFPERVLGYKYYLQFNDANFLAEFGIDPPNGWEEGHATGTNRKFTFAGNPEQDLGLQYFNDVTPDNVIPAGTSVDVEFAVDMTAALTYLARPFNPAEDSVSVRFGDPIWAFTQGMYESIDGGDFPIAIEQIILTDDDADNVYTGTFTVNGPTYSNLTYRYWYGNRLAGVSGFEDQGSDPNTPGRNRTHFIVPNPDGSWPSSYAVPEGTIQLAAGPLPFVPNPAFSTGIEIIDTELPVTIWLGDNYPNPFNPTTSIEYSIDRATHVKLRVYDLLGRRVATVVDGMLQPALYRSTFDASRLASGVYVYRLETDHMVVAKSMLLIK